MILNKAEKIVSVKATSKRKAHKRKITFEGKKPDSIQFQMLDITGLPDMDLKISHTLHDFNKRVAAGEGMVGAVRNMVDSKSKLEYKSTGIDDGRVPIIMGSLSKIIGDSNKGLTSDLSINISDINRSWYDPESQILNIGEDTQLSENIYHEYMHHLEGNKKSIHRACVKFFDKRTEGENEVKLNKLFPGIGYRDDEICKPDKFISPGTGKIYPYMMYTEILSVGGQKFTTGGNMKELYNNDREHFALTLAAITGRI